MTDAAPPTDPATPRTHDEHPPHAPSPIPRERDIFGREPVGYPDWSHRRAEPRVFALVWMLFLMGVTIIMFVSFADALSISPTLTRPAARRMVLATMVGIVWLWPAFRLSQQPAPRPAASVLRDLFVLLVPAQAVIWPHAMPVLANWPLPLLVAIACCMGAWALVVAGMLACADAPWGRRCPRWIWMLAPVGLALAVPSAAVLTDAVGTVRPDTPRVGWMCSPLTAVLELTRDRDAFGLQQPVHAAHWRAIAAVGCLGGAILLIARAGEVAWRGRRA